MKKYRVIRIATKSQSLKVARRKLKIKCIYLFIEKGVILILTIDNIEIMDYREIDSELNTIGKHIVNSAYKVHKKLGPSLLEKVYEVCFAHELRKVGLLVERQISMSIVYDNIEFDEALRLDVLVDKKVIVELKALDQVNPVWEAQVLSHLRLANLRLGYLINFNVPLIKMGIKRFVI